MIELFNLWDSESTGYIELEDLVDDLLAMGLAPNAKFAEFVILTSICSGEEEQRNALRNKEKKKEYKKFLDINDFLSIFEGGLKTDKLLRLLK